MDVETTRTIGTSIILLCTHSIIFYNTYRYAFMKGVKTGLAHGLDWGENGVPEEFEQYKDKIQRLKRDHYFRTQSK